MCSRIFLMKLYVTQLIVVATILDSGFRRLNNFENTRFSYLIYDLQVKNIDVWTKPIMPVIDKEPSLAIGFISNRIDGYPHFVEVPLAALKLSNSNGYQVQVSI